MVEEKEQEMMLLHQRSWRLRKVNAGGRWIALKLKTPLGTDTLWCNIICQDV